jgi:hypothetical protein
LEMRVHEAKARPRRSSNSHLHRLGKFEATGLYMTLDNALEAAGLRE